MKKNKINIELNNDCVTVEYGPLFDDKSISRFAHFMADMQGANSICYVKYNEDGSGSAYHVDLNEKK